MTNKGIQKPPKHLSESSKNWWISVCDSWELENHHRLLLTACCEALDRAEQARQAVANDGAFFTNRHGEIKPHPGLATERDACALFARLLRELQLDVSAPPDSPRPSPLAAYRPPHLQKVEVR